MVTNMKFYVLTVVAIFLALGIGIFIGFMFDAQEILLTQKEDIVGKLEERFNYLKEENQNMKHKLEELSNQEKKNEQFNKIVFPEIIKGRISGMKVAIIETNDDYIYSNVEQTLEIAGADVTSITTIKDEFVNSNQRLKEMYETNTGIEIEEDARKLMLEHFLKNLITEGNTKIMQQLSQKGYIDKLGNYKEPIDYIVIAGGSQKEAKDRLNIIDKKIIDYAKSKDIPIIGIEKEMVKHSYMGVYKDYRISTIDNIDSIIGKVSLIFAMEGNDGNYGVKSTAENLMPDPNDVLTE